MYQERALATVIMHHLDERIIKPVERLLASPFYEATVVSERGVPEAGQYDMGHILNTSHRGYTDSVGAMSPNPNHEF